MLIKCNECGHWYRADDNESKCQHCNYTVADDNNSSFMVEWWLKMKLQGIIEDNE